MDLQGLQEIAQAEQARQKPTRIHCCTSTGCRAADAMGVLGNLKQAVKDHSLDNQMEVVGVGCMGFCGRGPLVQVDPSRQIYEEVTPDQAPSIIDSFNGGTSQAIQGDPDHPFFSRQTRVVRQHSGKLDPERIEEYIAIGGYQSLYKALYDMEPADVVDQISKSGLRGRGGGGYPTGLKWATVAKMPGDQKYIICNGDEGDPGAFMDRSVLESDPHLVLEGMAIAGYAVGANHGYIYVRAEYPLAIQRLQKGIQQAKKYGLLGSQIFDSAFDFKIDIRIGAGAFVCGEETGLIQSIEGGAATPCPGRPTRPKKACTAAPP
jgi:bidirectional [NiFe] hydrogenase diaphorase subunit